MPTIQAHVAYSDRIYRDIEVEVDSIDEAPMAIAAFVADDWTDTVIIDAIDEDGELIDDLQLVSCPDESVSLNFFGDEAARDMIAMLQTAQAEMPGDWRDKAQRHIDSLRAQLAEREALRAYRRGDSA